MNAWQSDVFHFFDNHGLGMKSKPSIPDPATVHLRKELVREEFFELLNAIHDENLAEIADASGDLIYVILGLCLSYGIDLEPVWDAIQFANLQKVGGSVRVDGKILKPQGWKAPDIAAIIKRQQENPRYPLSLVEGSHEDSNQGNSDQGQSS